MARFYLRMVAIRPSRVAIVTIGLRDTASRSAAPPPPEWRGIHCYTCNHWTAAWNRLVTVRAYSIPKASPISGEIPPRDPSLSRPHPPGGFRQGEAFFLPHFDLDELGRHRRAPFNSSSVGPYGAAAGREFRFGSWIPWAPANRLLCASSHSRRSCGES